jgi:hypothetical protein
LSLQECYYAIELEKKNLLWEKVPKEISDKINQQISSLCDSTLCSSSCMASTSTGMSQSDCIIGNRFKVGSPECVIPISNIGSAFSQVEAFQIMILTRLSIQKPNPLHQNFIPMPAFFSRIEKTDILQHAEFVTFISLYGF